jgi:hypothetical protein
MTFNILSKRFVISVLTFLLLACVEVNGATLVAPEGFANTAGNRTFGFQSSGTRYQQSYAAGLFQTVGSPWLEISELRFRVDPNAPPFSTRPEIEVRMSTTTQNPDFLGPNWAANTGSDVIVALPRSVVNWSGNPGLSFDIVVPLPNHFIYSPNNGSLLVDISVFDVGSELGGLDAQSASFDGISSIRGTIGSATATVDATDGIVTAFVFQPIPEPSKTTFLLMGFAVLVITKRKYVTS